MVFGVFLILLFFVPRAPWDVLGGWLLLFLALALSRLGLYRSYRKAEAAGFDALLRWRRDWNLLTILSGGFWGLTVVVFYPNAETLQKIALIVLIFGYTLGSIQVLANQPRVFLAFSTAALGPTIIRASWGAGWEGLELAVTMLGNFGLTAILAHNYRKVYTDLVDFKIRNQVLVESLTKEKEAAEVARQAAVLADQAKTQFLAAASHDLRQPLHAVSLYAEVLRARSARQEVSGLVEKVLESIVALEGLFSELMDITKVDAGGMTANPVHFELEEIFEGVGVHARPLVFKKGLELKFRGGQQVVFADKNMLGRVLLNLVMNAVRYTEDGGVLVSARQRGGRLLLQVWDSGVGILEADQPRIFDDFYQVRRAGPLAADAYKGMGLGLAIVRRLVGLMNVQIRVQSRLGHGTVFNLWLPLGDAAQIAPSEPHLTSQAGLVTEGRLIAVLDDDPAGRESLVLMLKGWGFGVVDFDSFDACLAWADEAGRRGLKLDLAIVDYRLGDRATGVEAIHMLRRHFGATMPAVVLTGELASEVDSHPDRASFHLMLKPALPHKLRAMIAFKLGRRSDGEASN